VPPTAEDRNPFLEELLSLQQDGDQAISAPTNWIQAKPLLEVRTELDSVVADLAESCIVGTGNEVGHWHFFVGSPGNGKSAAVGQLVCKFIEEKGCAVVDEDGIRIQDLDSTSVPYSLDVYEPDKEFVSVRIVQDASVVRNPYSPDVDPAKDLIETLAFAWELGISLIVCTNRGVIEKAYRDTYLDASLNQQAWHKAILKKLAIQDGDEQLFNGVFESGGKRRAFGSLIADATFLDDRSLLLGESHIFDDLIQRATEPEKWQDCQSCDVSTVCPFKANRDWLAYEAGREKVLQVFSRGEVLSSQVVVFREALAAISFMLAGCACDYNSEHPCAWVRRLWGQEDIFGLASRRLYMCLFSSMFPRGLEPEGVIQSEQLRALEALWHSLPDPQCIAATAIQRVLEDPAPSSDVGVARLLGKDGVFCNLDPIQGPLPWSFYDSWDGNYQHIAELTTPFVSELDKKCCEVWFQLEALAENIPSHQSAASYWAVRRWSSQFTLHHGVLHEGIALFAEQIDDFSELLELLGKDNDSRTITERRRLQELEDMVEQLLNRGEGDGVTSISLTGNARVSGLWVDQHMRPKVSSSPASGSLAIAVRFGDAPDYTSLAAPMYIWLIQRATGTLDPRCIPSDLLSEAMDAKSRATAKSEYAFVPAYVSIMIHADNECYRLTRYDGEVDVSAEPQSQ